MSHLILLIFIICLNKISGDVQIRKVKKIFGTTLYRMAQKNRTLKRTMLPNTWRLPKPQKILHLDFFCWTELKVSDGFVDLFWFSKLKKSNILLCVSYL
jgi:hypothetical protein